MPELQAVARVPTERPERWIKQLVSHLGRRLEGSVDDRSGVGTLSGPGMTATLSPTDDGLLLEARADDQEQLDRITSVVGGHLERFAAGTEPMTVTWRSAG
jgi:hypothetical protein